MAIKVPGTFEAGTVDGILTDSKYIRGGYISVSTHQELEDLGSGVKVPGTKVYVEEEDLIYTFVKNEQGELVYKTESAELDVAKELEDLKKHKVSRYEAPVIEERRAYIVKPDGNDDTLPIHNAPLGNDLPIRSEGGQVKTANGEESDDAANISQLTSRAIEETIKEVVPKTTIQFALDMEHNTGWYVSNVNVIRFDFASIDDIEKGECKYIINWDGVDYEVYEEQFSTPGSDGDPTKLYYDWQNLGNANNDILRGYSPVTKDLPFTITQDRWDNKGDILIYATESTDATHVISVKRVTGNYKKLTPEYYYEGYAHLRKSKASSSASLGLNEIELRNSFAVGDGNKLRGNGSNNAVIGSGNKTTDSNASLVTGYLNETNGKWVGNLTSGLFNKIDTVQGTTVLGHGNTITKGSGVSASLVSGYKNTIGDEQYELPSDVGAPGISVLGYMNTIVPKQATLGGEKGSTGVVNILGMNNTVSETAVKSTYIGNSNKSEALSVSNAVIGNSNTLNKTKDDVAIMNTTVVGSANTVSNNVAQTHVMGDLNKVDGKSNAYVVGRNNTVDIDHQYVVGKYSAPDENAVYKFGYGTKDEPKNLFTLHEDGSGTLAGAPQNENDIVRLKELDSAFSDINIENGLGNGSLQQKYVKNDIDYSANATGENATAFGGKRYNKLTDANRTPTSAEGKQSFAAGGSSHAYGDYAIAMAKDNKSYQAASFTVGGGNQTGRTEAEFNDFYWDSVNNVGLHGGSKDANGNIIDAYGDTYADSYSFGGTFGEVNVNRGRDSIVGGINNKVDALQSIVAGDRNVSITGAKHIVAGFNNNVTDVNNTVNGDSNTVAGPNNVVGGYKNNVNGLANTINGANNTADGDYNLIEGQANITASRSSTIVGYKNAIGYTRDDNLSNAQKTKLEVRDEFVAGVGNTASHGNGGLIGCGLKTGKDEQVAVGVANEGKSNTVFEVGNGSYTQDDSGAIHITNRKNAFEVLDDGRAKVQTAPKENNDIVTLQYAKARFAALNDGTAIPDDADLNNYTTPGNYTYLGMNIKNAPPQQSLTKRFRMYVLAFNSDGAGAYRQIVISAENTIYWRSISDGFTTEWYKFTSGGEFITPSTATSDATSGTFTADEWSKLQANMNNKILFNNEIYRLNDPGHTPGIWSYVHTGWDGADIMDKSINVTVATGAWTLVTGQASGGGGKLYLHKVNLTGTYLIDIYSSYSTTFTYESFVAYLNKIARVIPCYIWADDGRAKYQLTRVGYISSVGIYTGWYNGNEYNDVYTYSIESDTVTEL